MSRRPGVTAAAMLALTFVVGGLAGMALEEGLGLDWFDFLDEDRPTEERLLSGLDLSGEQRAAIAEILDEQEERLEEYWADRIPDLRAIVAVTFDEMRVILTPEQRERFDRRIEAEGIPLPGAPD